jgi:hypothetical protein
MVCNQGFSLAINTLLGWMIDLQALEEIPIVMATQGLVRYQALSPAQPS